MRLRYPQFVCADLFSPVAMSGVPRSVKRIERATRMGNSVVTISNTMHIDAWHGILSEGVTTGEVEAVHLPSGQHSEGSYKPQHTEAFLIHSTLNMDIGSLEG